MTSSWKSASFDCQWLTSESMIAILTGPGQGQPKVSPSPPGAHINRSLPRLSPLLILYLHTHHREHCTLRTCALLSAPHFGGVAVDCLSCRRLSRHQDQAVLLAWSTFACPRREYLLAAACDPRLTNTEQIVHGARADRTGTAFSIGFSWIGLRPSGDSHTFEYVPRCCLTLWRRSHECNLGLRGSNTLDSTPALPIVGGTS